MTYQEQIDAQQAVVTTLSGQVQADQTKLNTDEASLTDAQNKLNALLADAVKGGPDVSQFQGDVTWSSVASAGYNFAFCRISDGDQVDTFWTPGRVSSVRSAGLILGVYYYAEIASSANNQRDGRSEAAMAYYFASKAGWGKVGDLPLVYDLEKDSTRDPTGTTIQGQNPSVAAGQLALFAQSYKGLTGTWPMLYSNHDTLNTLLAAATSDQKTVYANLPLWIADPSATSSPVVPSPWASWTFWQFTSSGTIAGITGNVDINHYSGSKTDLAALTIH